MTKKTLISVVLVTIFACNSYAKDNVKTEDISVLKHKCTVLCDSVFVSITNNDTLPDLCIAFIYCCTRTEFEGTYTVYDCADSTTKISEGSFHIVFGNTQSDAGWGFGCNGGGCMSKVDVAFLAPYLAALKEELKNNPTFSPCLNEN